MATRKFGAAGRLLAALALAGAIGLLPACSGTTMPVMPEGAPDKGKRQGGTPQYGDKRESVFGEGGLANLFGGDKKAPQDSGGGLGVNSYLWRASLDTISFMPVTSADPFGGVIITDWHSYAEAPDERFKLNVYILGRGLRADGVRVAVFRQVQEASGWRDAPVPAQTDIKIEDAILTRARQLRNETIQQ